MEEANQVPRSSSVLLPPLFPRPLFQKTTIISSFVCKFMFGFGVVSCLSQPVVIDNGTGLLKAGFAGADRPQASEALQRLSLGGR